MMNSDDCVSELYNPKDLPKIYQDEIIINPNETVWLFSLLGAESQPKTNSSHNMMDIIVNFDILDEGRLYISPAAYKNLSSVLSPTEGFIYTQSSENEGDRTRKTKGTSYTQPIVETDIRLDVNKIEIQDGKISVNVPNLKYIKENKSFSWITHVNPNNDGAGESWVNVAAINRGGTDSDLLTFRFWNYGSKNDLFEVPQEWYFGPRYTDASYQSEDEKYNKKLSEISDLTLPYANACSLGNYGVITRYNIELVNNTTDSRTFTYALSTDSMAYINYNLSNSESKTVVKLHNYHGSEFTESKIFEVTVPPQTTKSIKFEVMLTNGDSGGFYNSIYIN